MSSPFVRFPALNVLLRHHRVAADLTIEELSELSELSERSGVSVRTMGDIERGVTVCRSGAP